MNYTLDACALLAHLKKENEGVLVKNLFNKAIAEGPEAISINMSVVNLSEVYYGMIKEKGGVAEADKVMSVVSGFPFHTISTITDEVYREASRLKAGYSISLADAFACATAMSLGATLVTKDHEIEAVEQNEPLSVFWIDREQ
jgi:predicted nucleic acid-binding protein